MSDSPDHGNCDASNAGVTFFKNNHGGPSPSSEVGSEQALVPTTSSTTTVQPGTTGTAQSSTRLVDPASLNTSGVPVNNLNTVHPITTGISTGTVYTPIAAEIPVSVGIPFMPMGPTSYNQEVYRPGVPITTGSSNTTTMHPTTPMIGCPPQFMMQMMEMMQRMSERMYTPPEPRIRIKDIYLPSFDPDSHVGVREWCQHIDKAAASYKLNDLDLRTKVCGLLKGRAKMWIDDWLVTTSSWEEFREKLITTFEPENRYSRDILQFREHVYDSSKDISEFLSRAWVLWKRVTKDQLDDELSVEAVIGCIGDERLRIELLNAKANTVPELISVASWRGKNAHTKILPHRCRNVHDIQILLKLLLHVAKYAKEPTIPLMSVDSNLQNLLQIFQKRILQQQRRQKKWLPVHSARKQVIHSKRATSVKTHWHRM